jgi:large subunit ribosomal protein L7e
MVKKYAPENHLKKVARDEKDAGDLKASRDKARSDRVEKRQLYVQRAEKYFHEYQKHDQDIIDSKRNSKKDGSIFVEPEAKVLLVVRTKGILKAAPKPKKVLQLFRLRQINNAVFLIANKATKNMLKMINPFVAYGYPNRKTIKELVYKRGYGKVDGKRTPLSDNEIIEKELGKFGIICVEDLIHTITTCGPHFKEANNFLWPFKLSTRRGGYTKKRNAYGEGGVSGNREEKINSFIQKMI